MEKYELEFKEIEKKAIEYKKTLQIQAELRGIWRNQIKDFIVSCLEKIRDSIDLKWQVYIDDSRMNLESIGIVLKPSRSGVVESVGEGSKSYIKQSGGLFFTQNVHGYISIDVFYPYIEKISTEREPKHVKRISPVEINEIEIYKAVAEFLDEMIRFEKPSGGIELKSKLI